MSRRIFPLVLATALTAARAEIPIDLPADVPTNRPGSGINVPAPLGTPEPANAGAVLPPEESPEGQPIPQPPGRRQALQQMEIPATGTDSLVLTNGDRFVGALTGHEGGVIRWQAPGDKEPIRFRAGALAELTLDAPPPTNAPAPAQWLLFLADGSLLAARQVTVEGGKVNAEFSLAGHVRLERHQIAALRRCGPGASELVLFDDAPAYGATNRVQRTPSRWIRYRDTKLPDPVLVEFEWDGNVMLPVALRPFAGKAEDLSRAAAKAFFRLGLDENEQCSAEVRVSGPNEKDGGMWAVVLTDAVGRPAWVGFAFNRQRGEAALYLDGQWRNRYVLEKPVALPDFGLAVAAATQRRTAPWSVLVSPINEDLSRLVPPADQDAVGLVNGDQLVGRLESVGTNEVVFQTTTVGRMVLPLERVAQVNFPRGTNAPARAAETRFALRDGSTLRGVWQRADAQTVVVQNSALGPVALPQDTLREVAGPCQAATPAGDLWRIYAEQEAIEQVLRDGRVNMYADRRIVNRLVKFQYRPGTIKFPSGLEWHGDLIAITNGVVHWRHPAALDPLAIPLAEVLRIFPPARPLPANTGVESATVRLSNGDVLSGPLGVAGGETVNVTPWYAGPLAIPRRHAALVTPHPAVTNALELRWTAFTPDLPAPAFADGAVCLDPTQPGIRRAGPLPDRVRLDFEVVWPGTDGRVELRLFQPDDPSAQVPQLLVQASPLGVAFGTDVAGTTVVTNLPAIDGQANLANGGCAQITLFADRANRQLRLLVDGRPAGEWRGADVAALTGHGLSIDAGGRLGAAVRHIVLREWREDLPAPQTSRPVPVSPLSPAEVRVIFHNGDFLTLNDVTADTQTVTGRHALLGPVTLNLAAVRSLSWESGTGGARPAKR